MWTKTHPGNIFYLYGIKVLTIDKDGDVYSLAVPVSSGWGLPTYWFDNYQPYCFFPEFGAGDKPCLRDELYPHLLNHIARRWNYYRNYYVD